MQRCCYRLAMDITAGYTDWHGAKSQHIEQSYLDFFWLLGRNPVPFPAIHLPIPVVTMFTQFPLLFFFSPAAGITCIFSSPCTKKQWKGEEVASFWSTAVSLKLHRFQLCIEWLQSLMYLEWTSTHVCKGFVSLPDIAMRSKYSEFSSSKIHRFKGAE